jgi:Bardet-Biedl syndrome 2 protein
MEISPAFTLQLKNRIQPGLATVGKFDGEHPSLACATSGGKVFLHSPHTSGTGEDEANM